MNKRRIDETRETYGIIQLTFDFFLFLLFEFVSFYIYLDCTTSITPDEIENTQI